LTKIYYFSSTGNSLWSAKKIARIISEKDPQENCELVNIGAQAQKNDAVIEADAVVFVFPSYAYGLPIVVRRFTKSASFKTPYMAAFVTFGSSPGGTLGALRRIVEKKGIEKKILWTDSGGGKLSCHVRPAESGNCTTAVVDAGKSQ
jgi:flavodoxin